MPYNRISADCHLDLIWLPPDLFTSEAPAHLKDRMPYVADGPDERWWVAKNGVKFGIAGGVGASGTKHIPGKQLRVDVIAATGLYDDGKKGIRRPGDPHLRIKEMDRDGVDAEVIYGILAAAAKLKDIEASNEMVRIYNTWMADFCRHYPDRHIGLANLPTATSTPRSPKCIASPGSASRASSCPARGRWSRCGIRSGSRCGRRSTRSGSRCTSTRSRRCRPTCARSTPASPSAR